MKYPNKQHSMCQTIKVPEKKISHDVQDSYNKHTVFKFVNLSVKLEFFLSEKPSL